MWRKVTNEDQMTRMQSCLNSVFGRLKYDSSHPACISSFNKQTCAISPCAALRLFFVFFPFFAMIQELALKNEKPLAEMCLLSKGKRLVCTSKDPSDQTHAEIKSC